MPRPRTPLHKALITGQTYSNSTRFKGRNEPKVTEPIGPPPLWFNEKQKYVWNLFSRELFWLNVSHRALLEIACVVRTKLHSREDVSAAALNLLRCCLGQLGASPSDASKISVPTEEATDPAEKYFR